MGVHCRVFYEFFENSHFWRFCVKIDISTKSGRLFSGRVQDAFDNPNGFASITFKGMPSLVPKFAFLVGNWT